MRLLWSLSRAAPLLLRHLHAYGELLEQDFRSAREQLGARAAGAILFAVGTQGAGLMACVAVVAATWDTPHRMTAIYLLMATFVLIAAAAGAYLLSAQRRAPRLFDSVRREWALDSTILDRLAARDRPANPSGARNHD